MFAYMRHKYEYYESFNEYYFYLIKCDVNIVYRS
jgi:hypothetical protein